MEGDDDSSSSSSSSNISSRTTIQPGSPEARFIKSLEAAVNQLEGVEEEERYQHNETKWSPPPSPPLHSLFPPPSSPQPLLELRTIQSTFLSPLSQLLPPPPREEDPTTVSTLNQEELNSLFDYNHFDQMGGEFMSQSTEMEVPLSMSGTELSIENSMSTTNIVSPNSNDTMETPDPKRRRTNSKKTNKAHSYIRRAVSVQTEFKKFSNFTGFKPGNVTSLTSTLSGFCEQPMMESWLTTVTELLEERKNITSENNPAIKEIYQFLITTLSHIRANHITKTDPGTPPVLSSEAQHITRQLLSQLHTKTATTRSYAEHLGRKMTSYYLEKEKLVPEDTLGVLRKSTVDVQKTRNGQYLQVLAKPGYNQFNLSVPLQCKLKNIIQPRDQSNTPS